MFLKKALNTDIGIKIVLNNNATLYSKKVVVKKVISKIVKDLTF